MKYIKIKHVNNLIYKNTMFDSKKRTQVLTSDNAPIDIIFFIFAMPISKLPISQTIHHINPN